MSTRVENYSLAAALLSTFSINLT